MIAAVLCTPLLRADDATRSAQEELRKRNLYFGDVDGRQTPSVIEAIKKYQERKGFPVTGEADPDTLRSLGISVPETTAAAPELPQGPVLRSDRSMNTDRGPMNAPPPTPGTAARNAAPPKRAEMVAWVRGYFAACSTPDTSDELSFYADQVDYFHHGTVTKADIARELASYAQQWPTRRYWVSGPVTLREEDGKTILRTRATFELDAGLRQATGKVNNTFTLARRADLSWEIIGQEEERVRPASSGTTASRRRNSGPRLTPLDRTLRKFFGTPQKQTRKRR